MPRAWSGERRRSKALGGLTVLALVAVVMAAGREEDRRWKVCDSIAAEDFPARQVAVVRYHKDRLWAGADQGLGWTADAGQSWGWINLAQARAAGVHEALADAQQTLSVEQARRRNTVLAITADGDDLWVATRYGLCVGRESARVWHAYDERHGLKGGEVTAVGAFNGNVWAATPDGLFVSRNRGGTWSAVTTDLALGPGGREGFPASLRWIEVGEGPRGTAVWLAGFEGPLRRRGAADLICSFDGGQTWRAVATGAGAHLNEPIHSHASSVRILGSEVWACTRYGLAVSTDFGRNWEVLDRNSGLPADVAYEVSAGGGNLWAATDDGVCYTRLKGRSWQPVRGFNSPVRSIALGRTGVWMATDSGLVMRAYAGGWRAFGRRSDVRCVAIGGAADRPEWWAGTSGGLCVSRDRGRTWRSFTVADGLPGNTLTALALDESGNLWAGTDGGVWMLRPRSRSWRAFGVADGLLSHRIRDLAVDERGVWAATDRGIGRYDPKSRVWRIYQADLPWQRIAMAAPYVYAVTDAWIQERPKDLPHPPRVRPYHPGEASLVRGEVQTAAGEAWEMLRVAGHEGEPIRRLAASKGVVWAASDEGLFRSRDHGLTWAQYGEDSLWGGSALLAFELPQGQWAAYSYIRGASPAFGAIGVTTDMGRVWKFLPDQPEGEARAAAGTEDALLVGTDRGLWVREDYAADLSPGRQGRAGWLRLAFALFAQNDSQRMGGVSAVDPHSMHGPSIWMGSRGAGMLERGFPMLDLGARFPDDPRRYASWQPYVAAGRPRASDGLSSNDIRSIYCTENAVWVGTSDGLSALDRSGSWTSWYPAPNGLPAAPVEAVAFFGSEVWTGGAQGLAAFSPERNAWRRVETQDPPLPSIRVTALAAAGDALWVCTDRGGLRLGSDGAWRPFLRGEYIHDAQPGRSRIYFGTDSGLYGLDFDGQPRLHRQRANSPMPSNTVLGSVVVGQDVWVLTPEGGYFVGRDPGETPPAGDPPPSSRGPDGVVVIVNDNVPGSIDVGRSYARLRGVPEANLCHLRCPAEETISRAAFENTIREPVRRFLAERGISRQVSFLLTTYGVPLRIRPDVPTSRQGTDFGTDQASVDSDLCLVGRVSARRGPIPNPYLYRDEPFNSNRFSMYLVARLDGHTPAIAIEQACAALRVEQARTYSARGFAYFDLDPTWNREGGLIDEAIMSNYQFLRRDNRMVNRLKVDNEPREFNLPNECPAAFFYLGWFSNVYPSRTFHWLPGAIGVHIHAFSARSLREQRNCWDEAALADGLAATIGTVYPPGSVGVNAIENLYAYLHAGYTWAESAYMSTRFISWQTVVVGDPLYRPFP